MGGWQVIGAKPRVIRHTSGGCFAAAADRNCLIPLPLTIYLYLGYVAQGRIQYTIVVCASVFWKLTGGCFLVWAGEVGSASDRKIEFSMKNNYALSDWSDL